MTRLSLFLFIASLSIPVFSQEIGASEPAQDIEETDARFSLQDLQMFARLFEQVRQNYVEEVSDSELLEMAIRGMLSQLDPHSEFLDQEQREFVENTSDGTFYGVGLELTMKKGELIVVTPIDGSPAEKAGMQPGDVILEVDEQSVWGMNLSEALEIMAGEPGASMKLLITREDQPRPFEVLLAREKIAMESVYAKTLTHDIAYLRVRQFQRNSGAEFQDKLQALLNTYPYVTGLILDLRNNPGGILQAAVEISDSFLNEGLIVSTKGRNPDSELKFYASSETIAPDLPMVVLINQGSASASEIVAGALQDHNRAVIMGDISFGKGSVQNVVPIDDTRAIKLTTARYYTPSGRSIQAQGIFPDVSILKGEIKRSENRLQLSESDLLGHLKNDVESGSPVLMGIRETLSDVDDLQLAQALAFLKGLAIYNKR